MIYWIILFLVETRDNFGRYLLEESGNVGWESDRIVDEKLVEVALSEQ